MGAKNVHQKEIYYKMGNSSRGLDRKYTVKKDVKH
jgi:hypothetical protein